MATAPWHMPRLLRTTTLWIATLLWLSGALWMLLHYFFAQPSEFGVAPNPWEPTLIRVHGILAIVSVFLLGWLTSRHVSETWHQPRKRISGILLFGIGLLLVVSGYALYYLSAETPRRISAVLHEILGVATIAPALVHWFKLSSQRRL